MSSATGEMTRIAPADAVGIAEAIDLLGRGGIAALPTETVYGLAADAANAEAVARVFAAKGRPALNPLIVHVSNREMAGAYASLCPLAERLAEAFWPGPMTLVLPLLPDAPVAALVTAGLPTIALRVPAHPVMAAVIRGLDRGIAAPSANASGRLSPTRAAHVAASLRGRVPLILDGGPCAAGLESSIVAISAGAARLLRQGAVPLDAIEALVGRPVSIAERGDPVSAPGMLLSHYAPCLPMRLDAVEALEGEFHIGFGPVSGDASLSPSADLAEAAARLFELLHLAEESGRAAIAVAPVPAHGLGAAIMDRLRRAVVVVHPDG